MKKRIVKLTEGDLERIVKRIIKEDDGSFFNHVKKTILGDKIKVPNNRYYAAYIDSKYRIVDTYTDDGKYRKTVVGSFEPLEDGTFLMIYKLHYTPKTKVRTPSIERGLNYLKDIDDKKRKEDNKWDIDLTDTHSS